MIDDPSNNVPTQAQPSTAVGMCTTLPRADVLAAMQRLMAEPDGMTGKALQIELGGVKVFVAAGNIGLLVRAGRAVCVQQAASGQRHYFSTQAIANAWKATQRGRGNPNLNAVRHVPKAEQNITYSAGSSKVAAPIKGEPIMTCATRVTLAPTPLPRFHVPADHCGAFMAEWMERRA